MSDSPDQTGWWIGFAGVATAILTALGSMFATSRKQDAENEDRKERHEAGVMREVFDRQEERIATLEKRADDCEQDRANLSARVRHLETQGN